MLDSSHLILVIEDEISIRRFLKTALQSQGYHFIEAATGIAGIKMVEEYAPSVVLLDLGLPDIDGLEVIQKIRMWSSMPIIIFSARDQEQDKIQALDNGADDYLTKPFSVAELSARIRVALRHASRIKENEAPVLVLGDMKIDLLNRCVTKNEEKILLSPIQYSILSLLIRHRNKMVTHKQLLREVWGDHHTNDVEYLRIYIHQLRQKLEPNPAQPLYLKTEPGVGYRFVCQIE